MRRATLVLRRAVLGAVAAAAVVAAPPAAAQSLFSSGGLGLIGEAGDARGDALGGLGLGLPGAEISWYNPAGAVGLPAAGLRVSAQLDGFDATYGGRESSGSTARFPLILAAFPIGTRGAVTAGFSGLVDQNWMFEQQDTLVIGGDSVSVIDRILSDGGASRLRLAGAYRLLPGLSVGVGGELFTGGVRRVSGRVFPGQSGPACCAAQWTYSGAGVLGSIDWSPSEALGMAVAATGGGELRAKATAGEGAEDRSYDLPVTVTGGVSARLTTNLLVALGGEWGGWSSLNEALAEEGGSRDSYSLHGGIEMDLLNIAGRPLPLRLGARTAKLPFRWVGATNDWADERAYTGGTGMSFGGGAAVMDLSVERGRRGSDAAGITETYWRVLLSATVLGR